MILEILKMFGLVVLQNSAFTLVSRARQTKSLVYHATCAVASNGVWLLVMRQVVLNLDVWYLMVTYLVASVIGSVLMHFISMNYLEKRIN